MLKIKIKQIFYLVFRLFSMTVLLVSNTMAEEASLKWSGFATVAATYMNEEDTIYAGHIDDGFSFSDTRLGLNVSSKIQNDLFLAGQILMAGTEAEFNAHMDWLFVRYIATQNTSILFGKMKYPNLLFSEVYDVGVLYPWERVPQEVYLLRSPAGSNALYESIEGVSVLYSKGIGDEDTEISLQGYFGAGGMEVGTVDEMFGMVASLSDEWYEFKVGYNSGVFDPGAGGHGGEEEEEGFELAEFDGAKPDIGTLNLSASIELGSWIGLTEWTKTEFDGFDDIETETRYLTLGHNINSNWLIHVTAASFEQQTGRTQDSISLGFRRKINDSAVIKLGFSLVDATAPHEEEEEGGGDEHDSNIFGFIEGNVDNIKVISIAVEFVF